MKRLFSILFVSILLMALALPAVALDLPSEVTLFKNVNIFDGKSEKLLEGYDVLVVKNLIKKIDKDIKIAKTYEIDVKTGGLKEIVSGGYHSVQGNKVVMVYEPEKMVKKEVQVKVINGNGRTLMPGLIDAHWHTMLNFWPVSKVLGSDFGLLSIGAANAAERTLLRGFTTVRDAGGNCFPVKGCRCRYDKRPPNLSQRWFHRSNFGSW